MISRNKLSFITDEVSQDLDTAVQFAHRQRLTAVELRSVGGLGPFEWSDRDAAAIERTLKQARLGVCALSLPFFKCAMEDDAAVAAHLEGLARALELAQSWRVPVVRGFTFWAGSGNRNLALQRFEPVPPLLEKSGVVMALEPEPSVTTPNAAALRAFLDALDTPRIQALWDPGNLPFSEKGEQPFPQGYGMIKDFIAHVHLKDAVGRGPEARAVRLGDGVVGYPAQLEALDADGYTGFLSLETHYRLNRDMNEEELRLPGGAAFSLGGLEASLECFDALNQWIP
jgi:sugar phosphate isomerase/epimerase